MTYLEGGFQEAVVCVRDAAKVADELCQLCGWDVVVDIASDPRLLLAWGLPPGCSGREILLGARKKPTGQLRLLELKGVDQKSIRSNPQAWDVGGYLDLNVRVTNMASRFSEFSSARWYAASDPMQWIFGDKEVSEWLTFGPDGLALALIERLSPPLDAQQVPDRVGHIFNSSQMVSEMAPALAFYEDTLGFQKLLHLCQPLLPEPGPNILGIPHNFVDELDVEIAILSPSGEMDGSVELTQIHGLQGRDFSAQARPPNLGMLALRFPTNDLEALSQRLMSAGLSLAMAAVPVSFAPHGDCQMLAVQAPDGAWLEFYQLS
jgi:hypothetical protein